MNNVSNQISNNKNDMKAITATNDGNNSSNAYINQHTHTYKRAHTPTYTDAHKGRQIGRHKSRYEREEEEK